MSLHATTPPPDSGQDWGPLEKRLQEYSTKTCDSARDGFKYPGSVQVFQHASVAAYTQIGITDPGVVSRLIDNGILPSITIGSRSQGEHEYSTEFGLDGYVKAGVTSPDDMLRLRAANVTTYGFSKVVTALKQAGRSYPLSEIVGEVVRIAHEEGLDAIARDARTSNSMVHEFNHGSLGEQFQKWLDKRIA